MEEIIGQSKHIQLIRQKIQQLSKTAENVVIVGERGVGKGIVARRIHDQSVHSSEPFVSLDTRGVDDLELRSLIQSVLTKREFANPKTSDHGNFHLSRGTSLALDGVDELSLPGQKHAIDLIQGATDAGFGIRLMLLLPAPVKQLLSEGKLIAVFSDILRGWSSISIPPLRDRRDDIPLLVEHFVRRAAEELHLGELIIDINAVSLLVRREWKNNVQELKTFVEHALMLSDDKETFTLPESLVDEQSELAGMLRRIDDGVGFALDRSMELIERRILERVLRKFEFNQSRTARFLKITEDTLRYRMKKLGIITSPN